MAHPRLGPGRSRDRAEPSGRVITDARAGASDDLARRQVRYFIAMGFRVACFVGMVFVPGWARWVLLGIAVVIPTVAVTIANQADRRSHAAPVIATAEPSRAPELPIAASDIIEPDPEHDLEPDEPVGSERR